MSRWTVAGRKLGARHNQTIDALIITADDYGYSPSYDRGILEAAGAGAIDAVSVMVRRSAVEAPALLASGVEVGLHLELEKLPVRDGVAGEAERRAASASLAEQLGAFERVFGRPAAFLDGHHHCHATPGLGAVVGRVAAERGMPVRSVDPAHRRLLRGLGARTPDLLVGRLSETEPALPAEVEAVLLGDRRQRGVIEWMTHPGHPDPGASASYDSGRGQDLQLLLELRDELGLRRLRAGHALALGL